MSLRCRNKTNALIFTEKNDPGLFFLRIVVFYLFIYLFTILSKQTKQEVDCAIEVIISKNKVCCKCSNKSTYRNLRFRIQRRATKITNTTAMDDPTAIAGEYVGSVLGVSEMKQQDVILCNNVYHFLQAFKRF